MLRLAAGTGTGVGVRSRCLGQILLLLLSAVLIGACSNLPAPASIERSYSGRFSLAVTAAQTGNETQRGAWTGRFALAVGPQSLTLDLVTPLGATVARFETDSREARLLVPSDGGLREAHGTDAQALAEQVLGWSLPIERMPDWIEGRPSSGRPFHPLAAEEGSERFEQDGWSVTVQRIVDGKSGRHLQIERPARDGLPSVALRVVLDGPTS